MLKNQYNISFSTNLFLQFTKYRFKISHKEKCKSSVFYLFWGHDNTMIEIFLLRKKKERMLKSCNEYASNIYTHDIVL